MQSWPGAGQNGAGGQDSWQGAFPFGAQDGQFDPSQAWQPSVTDHASSYSHMGNPPDSHTQNLFNPASHQGDAFLSGSLHHAPGGGPNFHGPLDLDEPFGQTGQDVIDPAFSDLHSDIYGQQVKDSLNLDQVPNHGHAHGQSFQQHDYPFPAQAEQSFNPSVSQYSSNQLLSRSPSQHNQPVQRFDTLRGGFQQEQPFPLQPQQSPPPVHHRQPFPHAQSFVQDSANGQSNHFTRDPNAHLAYQQHQQPHPQPHQTHGQQHLDPTNFPPQKLSSYSYQEQGSQSGHQPHLSVIENSTSQPASSAVLESLPAAHISSGSISGHVQPSPQPTAEPPQAKKRKRATKAAETPVPTVEAPAVISDTSIESSAKRAEDLDSLPIPVPSAEEAKVIADFERRNKTAQAKYPSIKGLPHMVYEGSVRLPAPKSYDKLSPLVALPSRSGKPIVPELGYWLPCEVQGRFTSQYRPSFDKCGLDERRVEAKGLLDDYDRSMKALGKRQPKYTEYPRKRSNLSIGYFRSNCTNLF